MGSSRIFYHYILRFATISDMSYPYSLGNFDTLLVQQILSLFYLSPNSLGDAGPLINAINKAHAIRAYRFSRFRRYPNYRSRFPSTLKPVKVNMGDYISYHNSACWIIKIKKKK